MTVSLFGFHISYEKKHIQVKGLNENNFPVRVEITGVC